MLNGLWGIVPLFGSSEIKDAVFDGFQEGNGQNGAYFQVAKSAGIDEYSDSIY
jgi:hypothetical protein